MEPPSRLRIVMDTNQILKDIWYSSRHNTQTALQDLLQKDEYWVFMAEPVFQEVEEKLIELRRGEVDKQIALWRAAYVPYIWPVRLTENAYRDDPIIQEMRDSDDVPTAQLYLFLLPSRSGRGNIGKWITSRSPKTGKSMGNIAPNGRGRTPIRD